MSRSSRPTSVRAWLTGIAIAAVSFPALGVALKMPEVLTARAGLTRLYGKGGAHITKIKVNTPGWACGFYSIPARPGQWEFVESRKQAIFWAQEKSQDWLRDGAQSRGGRKWSDCMEYVRSSRYTGKNQNVMYDWLASALAGALG